MLQNLPLVPLMDLGTSCPKTVDKRKEDRRNAWGKLMFLHFSLVFLDEESLLAKLYLKVLKVPFSPSYNSIYESKDTICFS